MPLTADEIWRDFETVGVPASGAHKPIKADIRAWGSNVEALVGAATVPGVAQVPLFSNGVGVPPIYRAIVGFDLPNPSTTVPGAVFALPGTTGQVLSGLGGDGEFDVAPVTGTGAVVLQNNPNLTGSLSIGGVQFFQSSGGTHIFYAPDNRLGIQLAGAGGANFYKAVVHQFYNDTGTDLYATLDQSSLTLSPADLLGSATTPALQFTQTWNTTGVAIACDIRIINTASSPLSRGFRIRGGAAGATEIFSIFADASNPTLTMLGRSIFAAPPSSATFIYSSTVGVAFINAAGGAFLSFLSNSGVWSFNGATSGTHTFTAQANASGASTLPNATGELWNTGLGVPGALFNVAVDFNTANTDYPITVNLPAGFTRFLILGCRVVNTGTAASINTATAGLFTSAAGGGTALVASGTALSGLTSNAAGTSGSKADLTLTAAASNAYHTDTTMFFRVQTAQGAAASGFVQLQVLPLS